jgi:hypothetical protein
MWATHGIAVDFVGGKHHLHEVRARFECHRYVHIGDTIIDEMYAVRAGFEFHLVDTLPVAGTAGWLW